MNVELWKRIFWKNEVQYPHVEVWLNHQMFLSNPLQCYSRNTFYKEQIVGCAYLSQSSGTKTTTCENPQNHWVHPGRLTRNIIIEVWKIIFLSKWEICMFHVNLPGCRSRLFGVDHFFDQLHGLKKPPLVVNGGSAQIGFLHFLCTEVSTSRINGDFVYFIFHHLKRGF